MSENLFQYTGCALPCVFLRNGYREVETPYGKGLTIFNLEGLHRALAETVVASPLPLHSTEVRFLREQLELSQRGLGEIMGQSEQTIARWEKGKNKIDPSADRLLRLIYLGNFKNERLRPALEQLRQMEAVRPEKSCIIASVRAKDWQVSEAAA